MKERPILFSAPMVRAIMAGQKTQTRRAMNPQPKPWGQLGGFELPRYCSSHESSFRAGAPIFASKFGQPGDRLWVREATHRRPMLNLLTGEPMAPEHDGGAYTADGEDVLSTKGFDIAWWHSRKACPSIHMPRWASRITLEITGVRVERLQDISEADALAEGVDKGAVASFARTARVTRPAGHAYRDLWESINGAGSWDLNPWVWVVEFKRVEGAAA